MADLGTWAEPLGEGAWAEKGDGKERQLKPLQRREGMQHVRTAYLFLTTVKTIEIVLASGMKFSHIIIINTIEIHLAYQAVSPYKQAFQDHK